MIKPTLYKNSKTEEAIKAYDEALVNTASKPADKAKNLQQRCSVAEQQEVAGMSQAYKNSLRLDPAG
ncbi:MAG: hypothetical protein IPP96_07110 [Chitinophagaceae bacterium]|nr:hypothetical protein [Chitinophagaceae bacterium]